jgi:hypothetical protein
MRLKRKTVKHLASSSPRLALPKGRPRRLVKTDKRKAETDRISAVRQKVWERSGGMAELGIGSPPEQDVMHEAYPRCHTRGMIPEHRFDSRWCIRIDERTHKRIHAKQYFVFFLDFDGADGLGIVGTTNRHLQPGSTWLTPEQVWRVAVGRNLSLDKSEREA